MRFSKWKRKKWLIVEELDLEKVKQKIRGDIQERTDIELQFDELRDLVRAATSLLETRMTWLIKLYHFMINILKRKHIN